MFNKTLKTSALAILIVTFAAATAFAGVTVSSPAPGATVSSPVHFVASATSGNPVTSMTVYVDGVSKYQTYANKVDTYIALGSGSHNVVVQAWDSTGAVLKATETINVSGTSTAPAGGTGVTISSPSNGASVGSPVHFVASASAPSAIGAMRIYVDNNSVYSVNSNRIDTYVNLGGGTHYVVIQAWDANGTVYKASQTISVGGTTTATNPVTSVPSTAKTFNDIDQMSGWENCDKCAGIGANGPVAPHSMTQNISNPSMDGRSATFWLGGSTPFSSALWWKQLGGNDGTSHFVYDLYFYVKDTNAQAYEFDANQGFGGKRYIMGTQCNVLGSKQWDVWNAATGHWVPTGISCTNVKPYTWNHVTEEFARVNGQVQFISITLNGQKSYVNRYSAPQPIPTNVHELNVAVQLDTNSKAQAAQMWVDKISLKAW